MSATSLSNFYSREIILQWKQWQVSNPFLCCPTPQLVCEQAKQYLRYDLCIILCKAKRSIQKYFKLGSTNFCLLFLAPKPGPDPKLNKAYNFCTVFVVLQLFVWPVWPPDLHPYSHWSNSAETLLLPCFVIHCLSFETILARIAYNNCRSLRSFSISMRGYFITIYFKREEMEMKSLVGRG